MKKEIILLSLALSLLPIQLFAQGYVGATVGQVDVDTAEDELRFDEDTSWSVLGGYRINQYFAFEGSYVDFGKPDVENLPNASVEADAFDFAILGILPVTDRFAIFGRVGFMSWDVKAYQFGREVGSDDGEDATFGAGIAFNVTDQFSISAGFQRYDLDTYVDTIYLGAKFYFGGSMKKTAPSAVSYAAPAAPATYQTPTLRSVTETEKAGCSFVTTVSKGAGGPGDPSTYTESAMNKALVQAANAGADSYYVVNVDTTASGASVVLEALKCK
jgi:OOP family OmpA-OmpF porin